MTQLDADSETTAAASVRLGRGRARPSLRPACRSGCLPSGTPCDLTSRMSRSSWCLRSPSTGRFPAREASSQAFEERFLFLLLLLRQPRLRMIYVTSMPIKPSIVEYYLALLPGVIPSHAMARLTLGVGRRLVTTAA